MRGLLYPRLNLRQAGLMLAFAAVGAVIAGAYGVVHDQVTFTVGPEYFTKFKFEQFGYGGVEQSSVRWTVAKIGFQATWWVGFFAGWFMGRVTIPRVAMERAVRWSMWAVVGMMVCALVFAAVGYGMAPQSVDDPRVESWARMWRNWGIDDVPAFMQVGYVHNASYLGGLVALVAGLIVLRLLCARSERCLPVG
jgi:hypothetical protein